MGTQEGSPETSKQIQKGAGNDRVRCGSGRGSVHGQAFGDQAEYPVGKAESDGQAEVGNTRKSINMGKSLER